MNNLKVRNIVLFIGEMTIKCLYIIKENQRNITAVACTYSCHNSASLLVLIEIRIDTRNDIITTIYQVLIK